MAFTSSGSQAEVLAVMTEVLLARMPVADEDHLIVEVSEARRRLSTAASGRRLSTTTDWQVDYTAMTANQSTAAELLSAAEDLVSSSAFELDLLEAFVFKALIFIAGSLDVADPALIEMGASTTLSSTTSVTTTAVSATATSVSSVTTTQTTTTLPYVVMQTISFASSGTQEEVLAVMTEMLTSKLDVDEENLIVEVSEARRRLSTAASGRRLATDWQVDYTARAEDSITGSGILNNANQMRAAGVVFSMEMQSWFSSYDLQLDTASVSLTVPSLVEAAVLDMPSPAPTPGASPSTSSGVPVVTTFPAEEVYTEEDQSKAIIFVAIGGSVCCFLCLLGAGTELYVLRRKKKRLRIGQPKPGLNRDMTFMDGNNRMSKESNADELDKDAGAEAADDPSGGSIRFSVRLVKTSGDRSGFVLRDDGEVLRVMSVKDTGFVGEWNRAHPDQQIQAKDTIVSVNGTSDGCQRMRREFKDSETLELTIERRSRRKRPEQATVPAPAISFGIGEVDPDDHEELMSPSGTLVPETPFDNGEPGRRSRTSGPSSLAPGEPSPTTERIAAV
jgi:hypothetical protein